MPDRIEHHAALAASQDRVWRALTDYDEFGTWFRVALDAPFTVGGESTGCITYPGYEHLRWTARVVAIEPQRRFAFTWHPYAVDPDIDYSTEEQTLVEFLLEPAGEGTRLWVAESGFDRVPAHRRDEALRMNDGGWAAQMENIRAYVGTTPGR